MFTFALILSGNHPSPAILLANELETDRSYVLKNYQMLKKRDDASRNETVKVKFQQDFILIQDIRTQIENRHRRYQDCEQINPYSRIVQSKKLTKTWTKLIKSAREVAEMLYRSTESNYDRYRVRTKLYALAGIQLKAHQICNDLGRAEDEAMKKVR